MPNADELIFHASQGVIVSFYSPQHWIENMTFHWAECSQPVISSTALSREAALTHTAVCAVGGGATV